MRGPFSCNYGKTLRVVRRRRPRCLVAAYRSRTLCASSRSLSLLDWDGTWRDSGNIHANAVRPRAFLANARNSDLPPGSCGAPDAELVLSQPKTRAAANSAQVAFL